MVTAVASTPKQRPSPNTSRPLLLPSYAGNEPPRRPKAREINSRYLSLSTSSSSSSSVSSSSTTSSSVTSGSSISTRRSQSPILGSRYATTTPKSLQRAVSADRRRSPLTSTEKMLVASARNLSVSFQGESYAVPATKVKLPPTPAPAATPGGLRKATPERRKLGVTTPANYRREKNRANSRPIDQQQLQKHHWPRRLRAENSNLLNQSLDYGSDKAKLSGSGFVLRDLRKSMVDESSVLKTVTELKLTNGIEETRGISVVESGRRSQEPLVSDVESLNTVQLSKRVNEGPDPASPLSNYASNRTGPSKLTLPKKFPIDSPVSSPRELYPSRGLSPVRAASPCRALSSSSGAVLRGIVSPSRVRSKTGSSMNVDSTCRTPSVLSFATDARRGKLGENRIADAHDLRLLHNRLLQWRLVNAKVEHTMLVQSQTAERNLYDAWTTTFKLRHSVKSKEVELQFLRRSQKLNYILKKQEPHLENWGLLDRDYQKSISDAIKALEASTIRLPVVCGSRADVLKVQEAITSAVDVMQATASSVSSLLVKKVEQMNLLVYDLKKLSAREHCLLDEVYRDLFSRTFVPLQVMECSLRSRILQAAKASLETSSIS